ncbi:hypothetical protein EDD22DRAFT_847206 [Suillus occidentalis]|nr:hypothetical protein EDD22DRAFT_847206 [Suillus occidentalis]
MESDFITLRPLNAPNGYSLDDIYLGLDEELDTDSGSSAGPDVLDEIPTQSHPVQGDDLSLLNDPDLYLGPEDDLIEFDDALAISDSLMTVNKSMPEPHIQPVQLYWRHPYLKFMPIRSYDQTENCLGDYQQCYGHVSDPSVAQLLKANRLFHNA